MITLRIGSLFLSGMLCAGFALGQQVPAAPSTTPGTVEKLTLKEGSEVPLKFAEELNSGSAAEGDPVNFVLAADLTVNSIVVAKAGDRAVGEVVRAKNAGMLGKGGELNIRLDYLTVGTTKVKLRGSRLKEGNNKNGSMASTILLSPIGLIKHGKNIDVAEGTPLKAYVADDVALVPGS